MTRKDYVLIAEVLKNFKGDQGDVIDRDRMAYEIALAFEKENPRFDLARFLIASGVWAGCDKCGSRRRFVTGQGNWCEAHLPNWAKKIQNQISTTN